MLDARLEEQTQGLGIDAGTTVTRWQGERIDRDPAVAHLYEYQAA